MLDKNIANRQKSSIASNTALSNEDESKKEHAKIIDGLHTALEDCLSEEEVNF